ncbi:MAG: FapA family protein [Desulfocapsaceae bacterium]|nr:FapA family protein [Desulfocapsaceae bacterium]
MTASETAKKKYMEPVIHFLQKRIMVGPDETGARMIVSEFVGAGYCLAGFPDFDKYAKRGFEKGLLQAGPHTVFSEDGNALLACRAGYPKIETFAGKDQTVTVISIEPLVQISPDAMEAWLCAYPPVPGLTPLADQDLAQHLADAGVVCGVDRDAVQEMQDVVRTPFGDCVKRLVATGLPPGESIDASIRFEIEIGPLAGRLLDNGTIDFRERRIMVGVSAGQHIATKIPAVSGPPGMNVLGEEVLAAEGRDIAVKVSNDAAFSKDDLRVTATKAGVLSVVNNATIKVCSRQHIAGDIDFKTGNVESGNCLTIRGSVQPGFKVAAGGDLEINGGVMSATVSTQANVVVREGVTGKKSCIEAQGDVDIRFIEQGTIESGGIVVVRTQSYYSRVTAALDIRCQNGSKVVGGSLIAGRNMTLADVGSANCETTLLAAGVDAKRLLVHKELQDGIVQQQDEIIRWLQLYGGSARSKKIRKMEEEVASAKLKLLQLNLIPETGLYSRGGGDDSSDQGEETGAIGKVRIDVHGTIYPGTRIRIGNRTLVVDKLLSKRQFRLQKNLKSIIAVAL